VLEPINAALMMAQSKKSGASKLLFQDSLTCPKGKASGKLHDAALSGKS
jgi:hypothetical protein